MDTTNVFVGRERQLAQLDAFLNDALVKHGRICFITGDAGAGKTMLAAEFARRAEAHHKDLVVAVGLGDPQTGASDPYLIFREVLTMLTGDVEARLAQGTISQEGAKRLQQAVRTSIDCLIEYGPDLIGLLVPGANLAVQVAKIGVDASKRAGLMDRLTHAPAPSKSEIAGSKGIDQGQIFEQYVKVLKALAEHYPLVLILDDLQWADNSSVDLLFHLVRRIESSRILIVGLYRPAEIALGRNGQHHPLEKVLTELKRYHGDVFIDLDQAARQEGAAFIDAILDSEQNQLGPGFRHTLYERTSGNPLFVVELLRTMQEQGDIVHDAQGRWVEGPSLDWSKLPARAEGVIEARISRLTADLLEALKLASVQGEAFTAEVVAQIRDIDVREFVRQLGSDLEKRHRLVTAQVQQRIGNQRLSQYQFQNRLFQQYLYAALDPTERAYLHEDIGLALEGFYGDRSDEVATRLAWHFEEAGVSEKARHYLRRAGEQAAARSANAEAINYFTRALALIPAADQADRYALLLSREKAYHIQGNREAQAQDLSELETLAEVMADPQKRAEIALERSYYAEAIHQYAAAHAASQSAIGLAQAAHDAQREMNARVQVAWVLYRRAEYTTAIDEAAQVRAIARSAGSKLVEAEALRVEALCQQTMGSLALSRAYLEQSLQIYRDLGDRRGEAKAAANLAVNYRNENRFMEARQWYDRALAMMRAIGDRRNEAMILSNLGVLSNSIGDLAAARDYYEQALVIASDVGERMSVGAAWVNLSTICRMQGDYDQALANAQQALEILQAIGTRYGEGHAWTRVGHAQVGLGRLQDAANSYQQAVAIRRQINEHQLVIESLAGLARAHLLQGDPTQSLADLDEVLAHLAGNGTLEGTEEPFWIYFTCYEVLRANADPRAEDILETAYNLLQGQATKLPEGASRYAYLTNIPHHRQIVKAFTGVYPEAPAPQPEQQTAPTLPPVALPSPLSELEIVSPPAPSSAASSPQAPASAIPAPAQTAASPSDPAPAPTFWRERFAPASVGRWASTHRRQLAWAGLVAAGVLLVALAWAGLSALRSSATCPPDCAGVNRPRQNWGRANLTAADFSGANLFGAHMAAADLTGSTLIGVTLSAADLHQADLMAADAAHADFVGANLIGADLRGADLSGADLRGAVLIGADLTSADLRGARLIGANLLGARLNDADLGGADLRAAQVQPTADVLTQLQQNPAISRSLSKAALAALPLTEPDLTGVHYDQQTRWPLAFTPPLPTP